MQEIAPICAPAPPFASSPSNWLAKFLRRQFSREPLRPSLPWLLLSCAAAALVFWLLNRGQISQQWLEDLPIYNHAIYRWLTGQNPYNADFAPLYFLYPPVFLAMAGTIDRALPSHWGSYLYAAVHMASTVALPLILSRYYFRRAWMGPLLAVLLFFASPRFTGILAFLCGNVASTLYCLAFAAGAWGLKKDRWRWFYLAVFLAAIVKIIFLVLLLLPLLAARRQGLNSALCAILVFAANVGQAIGWPNLYKGFQWSLQQGVMVPYGYGYGIFGVLASYHHVQNPHVGPGPYLVSVLFSVGIVSAMFLLRRRLLSFEPAVDVAANGVWVALVVTAIILVNPRQMKYDVDIGLFAGFVLWMYATQLLRPLLLMVLLFLPSLAVPFVVQNHHLYGACETLLTFAGFALAYRRLWKQRSELGQGLIRAQR